MAKGELIGCFGLTEPTAGSDPGGMTTYARRDGSDWVLTGAKRWIGLASIAAGRGDLGADRRAGSAVSSCPTDTPGFTATPIEPKLSMRASIQCDITLDDVRLPADAVLPNVVGLKGPFACLNEARYGIIWGAMGAARDSYETVLRYSQQRNQFDKPLAGYQLTQRKLADMVLEIQKGILVALQTGRLKDAGKLHPQQISFGKLNNVREAIEICREARDHARRQRHHPGLLAAAARQQPGERPHLRGHRRGPHPDHGAGHHRPGRLPVTGMTAIDIRDRPRRPTRRC